MMQHRIAHYRGIAKTLRDGLEPLELDFLVPREYLSNTMTTVMLPEGWSHADLHAHPKERGYAIYKSQGHLSQTTFRLGTVGLMSQDDIRGFLTALRQVLRR
jgi:aspartate aminotransferase-like enzyme